MTRNKMISSLVIAGVLAASVSTSALAGDRGHNGNGAAIAAGILGAVVIGSLIANSQPTYAAPQPYYQPQPQPVYQAPPEAYYPPPVYQAPPQAYYRPQPVQRVYYAQPQPYYAPQPVVVVNGRYRPRGGYYYSR